MFVMYYRDDPQRLHLERTSFDTFVNTSDKILERSSMMIRRRPFLVLRVKISYVNLHLQIDALSFSFSLSPPLPLPLPHSFFLFFFLSIYLSIRFVSLFLIKIVNGTFQIVWCDIKYVIDRNPTCKIYDKSNLYVESGCDRVKLFMNIRILSF